VMRDTKGTNPDRHGVYFSIWRRQPDRTYKVILDLGIDVARAATFPDGFTPAPAPVPSGAVNVVGPSDSAIRRVEARFAEAASKDPGGAYRDHLMEDARLHRNERSPFVGRDAAVTFMASSFTRVAWTVLHAEIADSGDLAFAVGSYDAAAKASEGRPASSERGFFVRVWHRTADGWKIAFETNGIR
jgi:ketosteroid isomerase-like protein